MASGRRPIRNQKPIEIKMFTTERCKTCKRGFDASYDGNDYEGLQGAEGPHQYVQGCHKGDLPAMGYDCEGKYYEEKKEEK
jgi:hypothetical protein